MYSLKHLHTLRAPSTGVRTVRTSHHYNIPAYTILSPGASAVRDRCRHALKVASVPPCLRCHTHQRTRNTLRNNELGSHAGRTQRKRIQRAVATASLSCVRARCRHARPRTSTRAPAARVAGTFPRKRGAHLEPLAAPAEGPTGGSGRRSRSIARPRLGRRVGKGMWKGISKGVSKGISKERCRPPLACESAHRGSLRRARLRAVLAREGRACKRCGAWEPRGTVLARVRTGLTAPAEGASHAVGESVVITYRQSVPRP